MARLPLMLLPLLVASPAWAQQTDEQAWFQANGTTKIDDKTTVTIETIARFSDKAGGFAHDEFGGMISRKVSKNVEIAIGYRHVDDYDHGVQKPNEERLRQVITINLGGGFAGRLRFEQRFHSAGNGVGVRVRPQIRFTRPLGNKGVSFFYAHEDFLNFNDTGWGQRSGLERMRNTVGLTLPLAKRLKSDISYLNQYRFGRDGARDQMENIAAFALTLTL